MRERPPQNGNRYRAIIENIFFDRYEEGATELEFERGDIVTAAADLGIGVALVVIIANINALFDGAWSGDRV